MNDSDVNFETASEGEEEITMIENVADDDTILSPAINLNPGSNFLQDVDLKQTSMESFLFKPQSTLSSQMCEHTSVDETRDEGSFQLAAAQKPPTSPPLNT